MIITQTRTTYEDTLLTCSYCGFDKITLLRIVYPPDNQNKIILVFACGNCPHVFEWPLFSGQVLSEEVEEMGMGAVAATTEPRWRNELPDKIRKMVLFAENYITTFEGFGAPGHLHLETITLLAGKLDEAELS